jgi:hypothetical protein
VKDILVVGVLGNPEVAGTLDGEEQLAAMGNRNWGIGDNPALPGLRNMGIEMEVGCTFRAS